jgi:uncharacterized protein GlcG (DUF336 family)
MISLAEAQTIVTIALAHARAENMPPMTVAVLDAGAHLVAFSREDRSSLLREKISRAKAHGALNLGVGSRALVNRAETHPQFFNSLVGLADGDVVPVPGGVLVRDAGGEIIGAVGVSGSQPDADEACAVAGILATGLVADPGE